MLAKHGAPILEDGSVAAGGAEHGRISDADVCLQVDMMHPAVLVRYLRLCTAVCLAVRAPQPAWELLYAWLVYTSDDADE